MSSPATNVMARAWAVNRCETRSIAWSNELLIFATKSLRASCRIAIVWRMLVATSGFSASSFNDASRTRFSVPAGSAMPFRASTCFSSAFASGASSALSSVSHSSSLVSSSRWTTVPSRRPVALISGCVSTASATLFASDSSPAAAFLASAGSIWLSRSMIPRFRWRPRLFSTVVANCVSIVTPMLRASMITVRPIRTSSDFSMRVLP